eukprot:s177_g2.t1
MEKFAIYVTMSSAYDRFSFELCVRAWRKDWQLMAKLQLHTVMETVCVRMQLDERAVLQAEEEQKEEAEVSAMGKEDPLLHHGREQALQQPSSASGSGAASTNAVPAFSAGLPHVPVELQDDEVDVSFLVDMERELAEEDAKHVPVTPPMTSSAMPASPRASPTIHVHEEGGDDSHEAKKAKVEAQKKLIEDWDVA